eukprot:36984-Rhodomonas_salina.1
MPSLLHELLQTRSLARIAHTLSKLVFCIFANLEEFPGLCMTLPGYTRPGKCGVANRRFSFAVSRTGGNRVTPDVMTATRKNE